MICVKAKLFQLHNNLHDKFAEQVHEYHLLLQGVNKVLFIAPWPVIVSTVMLLWVLAALSVIMSQLWSKLLKLQHLFRWAKLLHLHYYGKTSKNVVQKEGEQIECHAKREVYGCRVEDCNLPFQVCFVMEMQSAHSPSSACNLPDLHPDHSELGWTCPPVCMEMFKDDWPHLRGIMSPRASPHT